MLLAFTKEGLARSIAWAVRFDFRVLLLLCLQQSGARGTPRKARHASQLRTQEEGGWAVRSDNKREYRLVDDEEGCTINKGA